MDSIDTLINEIMERTDGEIKVKNMLRIMEKPPMPALENIMTGFDFLTELHGIKFDWEDEKVTIAYRVIDDLYPTKTISFERFKILSEGILVCKRRKKW